MPSCTLAAATVTESALIADLLVILASWGSCAGSPCPQDLDDDDVVGFGDLLLALSSWGPC